METGKRPRVLFLASWYPSRLHPLSGIFIKKHAEVAARCADVAVLYAIWDSHLKGKTYDVECGCEAGVFTVRIYIKSARGLPRALGKLVEILRYMRAGAIGRRIVLKEFGRPDIVHVHVAVYAGLWALLWKRLYRSEYLITEHLSIYTDEDSRYTRLPSPVKGLIRRVFHQACAVTTVSTYLMEALKKHDLLAGCAYILPNVVNVPWYGGPTQRATGRLDIVSVALLNDRAKNFSGLLRAFQQFVKRHPEARLHLLGDGDDRAMLEALAAELGLLNTHVCFHGNIPNEKLHEYFCKAHFFVLNSHYETFSVATVEALIHGVPVVMTRCGGPERFVTEEVGILVEKDNEASLVEGMECMARRWSEYDPLRLHAYAQSLFGPEGIEKQLAAIYDQVLEGSGAKIPDRPVRLRQGESEREV